MSVDELAVAHWRKSSRSNGCGGNNCVEVAELTGQVAVRDSKDRQGPVLIFTSAEWQAFLAGVRDGEFDLADGS
ncbi:DUF397 domain-containing protein [Actinoplanes sp. NPDC023936]|uniref:DUF397 domain-containing protein n=1 Tax=Actinoplanes sp. NPDC023936 TaxID=3154910 RepID=UPI0033E075A0